MQTILFRLIIVGLTFVCAQPCKGDLIVNIQSFDVQYLSGLRSVTVTIDNADLAQLENAFNSGNRDLRIDAVVNIDSTALSRVYNKLPDFGGGFLDLPFYSTAIGFPYIFNVIENVSSTIVEWRLESFAVTDVDILAFSQGDQIFDPYFWISADLSDSSTFGPMDLTITLSGASVPEPSSVVLVFSALGLFFSVRRRKRLWITMA